MAITWILIIRLPLKAYINDAKWSDSHFLSAVFLQMSYFIDGYVPEGHLITNIMLLTSSLIS